MGSFIIKSKRPQDHEQVEVHYDELGLIFKIEIYSPLLNRDVNLDIQDFARENPVLFHQWHVQAAEENILDQENSEPNPAA